MLSSKQDSYIYIYFIRKRPVIKETRWEGDQKNPLLDDNIAITEHDNSLHAHQTLL